VEVILDQNADGTWPSVTLPTGARHRIILRRLRLEIERVYHDDRPVVGAPFTVELADGNKIEGKLDEAGKASVKLSAPAKRIQFGPDERDWTRVDQEENPDRKDDLGDVDAFVNERFSQT
jgi:hypothetical protein